MNLLIHAATAPLFVLATVGILAAPLTVHPEKWWGAGIGVLVFCVLLQRGGHSMESRRADRAAGPRLMAALAELLAEQFVTFPRFVLSGGWARNWRQSPPLRLKRPGRS